MARKTRTRIATVLVAGLAAASLLVAILGDEAAEGGRDAATLAAQTARPGVEAYFQRESYRPGDIATLVVDIPVGPGVNPGVQGRRCAGVRDDATSCAVCRSRRDANSSSSRDRPAARASRSVPGRRAMYYGELRTADGRVGYATFVLAPRRLGEHRVAIVMPTNTWFAYNRARRRRKRGGRHLVRGRRAHARWIRPARSSTAAFPRISATTTSASFVGCSWAGGPWTCSRSASWSARSPARSWRVPTTSSSFPGTTSTSPPTSSTSSSATATSAATSCSSRPTTSSTRSPRPAT